MNEPKSWLPANPYTNGDMGARLVWQAGQDATLVAMSSRRCVWTLVPEAGFYFASCDEIYLRQKQHSDDYCPHCGKRIEYAELSLEPTE